MIDFNELRAETTGRWEGIFSSLGIEIPENRKHGPCPICGGDDRFRCDDIAGSGSWFCNQCDKNAGNGFSLVRKYFGLTFPETLKKIAEVVGMCEVIISEKPKTDPKKALNSLWKKSTPLTGSDPVSKYLHSRGLTLTPLNVRYCAECYEPETKTNMPAMVARIQNAAGQPISLHRTYLKGAGKSDIESPKKIMPGTETLSGAAIRLFSGKEKYCVPDTLGVAEGVETAISCTVMFGIATWACLSNTILESFMPPENIRKIIVYADFDSNYTGQKSAYILASKLYKKGLIVDVEIPDIRGDFNDILMSVNSELSVV